MARVIGIDYGKKRVGVAVTDPLQLIASPLKTIKNTDIFLFLKHYLQQEVVEAIVVGSPFHLRGGASEMSCFVDRFIFLLKKKFPKTPIFTFDERFTSVMAKASLVACNAKKKVRKNKAVLDVLSATFILRSFLVQYKKVNNEA